MSKPTTNRTYAATFLLDTRGYTEPVDTLIAKLRDAIISVSGEVTKVENHGQRDFQRPPSRGYPNGIFVTFNFTGPKTAATALRDKMRLAPNVNRIHVVST